MYVKESMVLSIKHSSANMKRGPVIPRICFPVEVVPELMQIRD